MIYRKAGRYDPKSIKNMVVQKMISTQKKSEYKNFKPKRLDKKHLKDIRDIQNEITETDVVGLDAQTSAEKSPQGPRASSVNPQMADQLKVAFQS